MGRLSKDFWVGLVMLTGSAIYWMGAGSIPISPLDGEVNAAAMPRFLAAVLALLSVLLMIRALLIPPKASPADSASADAEPSQSETPAELTTPELQASGKSRMHEHMRAAGLIVIGALYLVALPYLGYLLSVALLVGAVSIYMGERPSLKLVFIAIGLAVVYQLFFVQLLHIQLPAGFLGPIALKIF